MKKILYLALTVLLALAGVSCKKVDTSGSKVFVQAISMDDKFSIALDASTGYLKVSVSPKEASLSKSCKVKCEPEGIIECALMASEVAIDPKAIGSTTLTVSSKNNSDIKAECMVTVTEHSVDPVSVSIVKTDIRFADGVLCLAEGDSYQLEAKVKNELGAVTTDFPLEWSILEGAGNIELNAETGTIKAKATSATAKVRVTVSGFPALSDEVSVKILSLPTSISDFYFTANYQLNPDGELILKKGKFTQFKVSFKPEGSLQTFDLSCSDYSTLKATASGNTVTLTGLASSKDPVTVTVSSPYGLKKQFKVYVFDYDKWDVKEGDWVFCNGSQFWSRDCGLRFAGTPNIYEDAAGRRSSSPKTFPGTYFEDDEDGTYYYIGVVVSTFLPKDDDFMGCSWLNQCRDGASATGLYEYRNLRKSNLCGFINSPSTHALVVEDHQLTVPLLWSAKTEMIVKTADKKDGLYQFQLVNTDAPTRFAFCENEADYMTNYYAELYEGQGWSQTPPVYTWCESGVVSHLLLQFYSNHVNDTDYRVQPVWYDALHGKVVPDIATGKTSGWFLPGKYEWEKTGIYLTAVNASLEKSGQPILSGNYWSTQELDKDRAYRYNVSSTSGVVAGVVKKDKEKANQRFFLYL